MAKPGGHAFRGHNPLDRLAFIVETVISCDSGGVAPSAAPLLALPVSAFLGTATPHQANSDAAPAAQPPPPIDVVDSASPLPPSASLSLCPRP
jgi:hypothetical protein